MKSAWAQKSKSYISSPEVLQTPSKLFRIQAIHQASLFCPKSCLVVAWCSNVKPHGAILLTPKNQNRPANRLPSATPYSYFFDTATKFTEMRNCFESANSCYSKTIICTKCCPGVSYSVAFHITLPIPLNKIRVKLFFWQNYIDRTLIQLV
jgi:hypothetical protein